MDLVIRNNIIKGDIESILNKLKIDSGKPYLFKDMNDSGNDEMITCPYHSNGRESRPSCGIIKTRNNPKLPFGTAHCFTCGKSVQLPKLVADVLEKSLEEGEEWLISNFGEEAFESTLLPEIELNHKVKVASLNEDILKEFDYHHPYMWKRGLTKEVVDKFRIGYDSLRNAITFPVWDDRNRLKLITARSVTSKRFWIPRGADKPVYLLNYILKEGIDKVYVAESQINTLTLWGWNKPAIGLMGTGSKEQYEILRKSGIRHYILCLDGDEAGDRGIKRFIYSMPKDIIIDVKSIPRDGRDVNDLSMEEFENLPLINSSEWISKNS